MRYTKVYVDSFGYELPPNVVTSDDIEQKLEPLYAALHLQKGQLEALSGIRERRYWNPIHTMYEGALRASVKAIDRSGVSSRDIGMLVYGGVCRDNLEPATACAVAHGLNLGPDARIYDVSNACLGVINGMIQVANAIELGQIKAGLVVACESCRQIVESTMERLLKNRDMQTFKKTFATLTGGSGAAAVLLTDGSFAHSGQRPHRLIGGVVKNAACHHRLCIWGPDTGMPASGLHVMQTDSVGVLKNGVALAIDTFEAFKKELVFSDDQLDKIICHQVSASHQKILLEALNIPREKDFTTFEFLGNMGTVSLPITAAIAEERNFFNEDDFVAFMGIGSGLNCLMVGIRW